MSGLRNGYTRLRLGVGGLLLLAAILKGFELATHGLPPLPGMVHERWFLTLVVEAELALGVVLLAGVWQQTAWAVAILYFLTFTAFTSYEAWIGKSSCGCFGGVKTPPIFTLVLDLLVLAGLMIWRPDRRTNVRQQWTWPAIVVGVGVIAIGLSGAELMMAAPWIQKPRDNGEPAERESFAVLTPGDWIGKEFWLGKYIDVGPELSQGKWIVVIYASACPHCQAAMPAYREAAKQLSEHGPHLALVQMAPYSSEARDERWKAGKLSQKYDWFVKTPVEVLVVDGVVKFAKEGGDGLSWWRDPVARTPQQ